MDLILARSPLLLLGILLVAAAFTWWSYGRLVPRPAARQHVLLGGLRFGALALVLLLLFDPIVHRISTQQEAPIVAVLVDDTRSLAAGAEGLGAEQARAIVGSLPPLDAELRVFRFARDIQPLEDDGLGFDGARTDIANALEQVRQRFERRNLRAVVLVSDGRFTSGRSPLYVADRFPVPIYTVTVGDTLRRPDVLIADVLTNEVAYAGVALPVRVSVRATGFAGTRATVTLSEGGRVLAQEALTLPEDGLAAAVELGFVPENEGLRRYAAAVTRFDGEATHENNATGFAVRLLPARRNILLLAAAPEPDLAALRQELERDPHVVLTLRTPRAPGEYYEGPLPAELSGFDLIILAGFPGRGARPEDVRQVARAAAAGVPVLFILSRQTDLALLRSELAEVLPAIPEVVRPAFLEAQLHVTGTGATHPVLSVPGVPPAALDRLPPVLVNESRWTTTPDARVLASPRMRGIELDDPVLVVRRSGRSRSAALLATTTWRWRNLPADLQDLGGFYGGLMQHLVTWLTAREDDRPVRVRPVQDLFDTTEPARFTGQVYDEALQPVDDASLVLSLTAPDGTELPFLMRPLGSGRFEVSAGTLPEGDYAYFARAERAGVELGSDRGTFAVGRLDLEVRELTADPATMREIARRSGGGVLAPDAGPAIGAALADRLEPRPVATTHETELRRLTPLLALLIGLLSLEWALRKRLGMA